MRCKCGYDFCREAIKHFETGSDRSESYAVIRDKDYSKFMKLELKWASTSDKDTRSYPETYLAQC